MRILVVHTYTAMRGVGIMALWMAMVCATVLRVCAQDQSGQSLAEDDWWLPEWVTPSSNSGISFYGPAPVAPVQGKDVKLVYLRWKDVEPLDDSFDWSALDQALNVNSRSYLRLDVVDSTLLPSWLFVKYPDLAGKVFSYDGAYDTNFGQSPGRFIPLWHPGVRSELEALLADFKAEAFALESGFHHAYFPFAWKWGEWNRVNDSLMIADGLDPQEYLSWWYHWCDSALSAMHGMGHKWVMTGGDIYERTLAGSAGALWRDSIARKMTAYTASLGFGARTGLMEKYNFVYNEMPNWALSNVREAGRNYMVLQDDHPWLTDSLRIYADEHEEYCFGNNPCDYFHFKMGILRMLQMRMNWMYTNVTNYEEQPELHRYFELTAGKRVGDSPDAWCMLRQQQDIYRGWTFYPDSQNYLLNNWERWLYQREVAEGGATAHAAPHDDEPYRFFNGFSHEAKRTQHSLGQDYIYFDVDSLWYSTVVPVLIKVTYRDELPGSWQLQYHSTDGNAYKAAPEVVTTGDGAWKTVSVSLADGLFSGGQEGGNDFRLYNGGAHDLKVRMVRVVKLEAPLGMGDAKGESLKPQVYPNPSRGRVQVRLGTSVAPLPLRLSDMQGRVLLQVAVRAGESEVSLDLSTLPQGLYLLCTGGHCTRVVVD